MIVKVRRQSARRNEVIFLTLLTALYLAGIFINPLFPFTRFALFSDSPREEVVFFVSSLEGVELDPLDFGLGRTYDGDPTMMMGRIWPSINTWESPPSEAQVRAHLERLPRFRPDLKNAIICIKQSTFGTDASGRYDVVKQSLYLLRNGTLDSISNFSIERSKTGCTFL